MKSNSPIVLCVLDGWGEGEREPYNAIYAANPNFYNSLITNFPYSQLQTSGESVGLPKKQMGNSEVGHMTIGSGRIIQQDLLKITRELNNNQFLSKNNLINNLIAKLQNTTNTCHLVGLTSSGGVHSHINHAICIAKYFLKHNIKVNFHIICDGRDTSPKSALQELKEITPLTRDKNFSIATISGRYYAMDRDKRYERTEKYYDALINARGRGFSDPKFAIDSSYKDNITDEFILPHVSTEYYGAKNGDGIIFLNFRPDRMRQLVHAVADEDFTLFPTRKIQFAEVITLSKYSAEISKFSNSLFKKELIKNTLGEVLSKQGLKQLRIAETEKYPHVTYFFNGGIEKKFEREDRILIPSPRVATYDLKPEMSAQEVTRELNKAAKSYHFILVNFANTDMVGHTGNYEATIKSVEVVDDCLQKLYKNVVQKLQGTMIVTADHGNAEEMFTSETQEVITSHSLNPVPFIIVNERYRHHKPKIYDGTLADIAPTILYLLKIAKPADMTGKNLIKES